MAVKNEDQLGDEPNTEEVRTDNLEFNVRSRIIDLLSNTKNLRVVVESVEVGYIMLECTRDSKTLLIDYFSNGQWSAEYYIPPTSFNPEEIVKYWDNEGEESLFPLIHQLDNSTL